MYIPLILIDYDGGRRGSADQFGEIVHFRHLDGTIGISLGIVLRQDWDTVANQYLVDCDSPALPDNIAAKISLRIQVSIRCSFVTEDCSHHASI